MMVNNTQGITPNGNTSNGISQATDVDKAMTDNGNYIDSCNSNIENIKESLLKRDSSAQEYTPTAIDAFNRSLAVNDPEVNRQLHDAMQDAEEMLANERKESNNPPSESGIFDALGNLFSKFKNSTDKSKINDKLRAANSVFKRVEESTNLGKEVFLDLSASRINLQNEADKMNRMLEEKSLTVDDLFSPSITNDEGNADLVVQMRQLNAARDYFEESCVTAHEFATAKNEDASVATHVDTCDINTINRINAEAAMCRALCQDADPDTNEPNPLYKAIKDTPETSMSENGSLELDDHDVLEGIEEALEQIKELVASMNPFTFLSKLSPSSQPSNEM